MLIRDVVDIDVETVSALWETCALVPPWSSAADDIRRCRANPSSTILVGELAGRVVATAMVGTDGHRGWIYYVAVQPELRRRGHARRIVEAAEAWLAQRGAPRMLLMVHPENSAAVRLYESLGYARSPMIVFGKQQPHA
jgi:ribosomal protein S18 acetylase RimI-like enzyme